MRFALALGLLIALCASANGAAVHHHRRTRQHVIIRPNPYVPPPWHFMVPGWRPIPPEENRNFDPSTRGSA